MIHSTPHSQQDLAQTFAALGDPIRMTLVLRLLDGEGLSLSDLSKGISITRQAVRKHLETLTRANLISSRKVGRETIFNLEKDQFDTAGEFLNGVAAKWDDALWRLKDQMERQ